VFGINDRNPWRCTTSTNSDIELVIVVVVAHLGEASICARLRNNSGVLLGSGIEVVVKAVRNPAVSSDGWMGWHDPGADLGRRYAIRGASRTR
jgi:hypothetical protein